MAVNYMQLELFHFSSVPTPRSTVRPHWLLATNHSLLLLHSADSHSDKGNHMKRTFLTSLLYGGLDGRRVDPYAVKQVRECSKMSHRALMFYIVMALQVRMPPPILPMVFIAPGNDTTLPCFFSASEHLNLNNLIINWQHGKTVVHSFYHGRDQLERQGETYKNRTRLFTDKILSGNAVLHLTNVQLEDQGEYTCHVTTEQETTSGSIMLTVAAPYDEPVLIVQPTCDGINITANFSNGFPLPELRWLNSNGGVINEIQYLFQQDSRGRYEVSRTISVSLRNGERVTMEMTLEVIGQSFTRSLYLHPLPNTCQECCQTADSFQSTTAVVIPVVGFILIGLIFTIIMIRKRKRSQEFEMNEQ